MTTTHSQCRSSLLVYDPVAADLLFREDPQEEDDEEEEDEDEERENNEDDDTGDGYSE
jgi:hypothetical protein